MSNISADFFIKRLGIYRNLSVGTISYANITFRMVGGVLGGLPPESVSFFTSIERFLWLWMEVPGGRVADKWGRVKTAILGYSFMLFANISLYLAYLSQTYQFSINPFVFLAFMGVFIGIGGPLVSASVEAYYQELLERHCSKEEIQNRVNENSFSLSARYGRYLPLLYVLISYSALFICHKTIGAGHSFLGFIVLDILLILFLVKDLTRFGDPSAKERKTLRLKDVFLSFSRNYRLRYASALDSVAWLLVYLIGYYSLLSLGREIPDSKEKYFWPVLLAFTICNKGLSPILQGFVLPKMSTFKSDKNKLLIYFGFLFVLTLMTLIIRELYMPLFIISFILFTMLAVISIRGVSFISKNLAIKDVSQSDYATILSIKLMPPQLAIFLLSSGITLYLGGAPTIRTGLIFSIVAILFGMMTTLIYREKFNGLICDDNSSSFPRT